MNAEKRAVFEKWAEKGKGAQTEVDRVLHALIKETLDQDDRLYELEENGSEIHYPY